MIILCVLYSFICLILVMMKRFFRIVFFLVICGILSFLFFDFSNRWGVETVPEKQKSTWSQHFLSSWLMTNTDILSIDINDVLDGWPGKDWIPALHKPLYRTVEESVERDYLGSDMEGIVVAYEGQWFFYPISIMNRHEIVTDTIGDIPVSITFCPLCGSAIVYDRRVDWKIVHFGVSWKLLNSNLLMYDDVTETLWSQSLWRWVVWEYTDTVLLRIDSQIMSFEQFSKNYPEWNVLSDETWFSRDYTFAPYWGYDTNDVLYFPVANTDARLPKKEILYVVNDNGNSLAFVKKDLIKSGVASLSTENGNEYVGTYQDGVVTVENEEWTILPWYHEMRFSRVIHNPNTKNIWFWTGE